MRENKISDHILECSRSSLAIHEDDYVPQRASKLTNMKTKGKHGKPNCENSSEYLKLSI